MTSGAQRASQTLQLLGEQQAKKKGMLSSLFCSNADAMAMQVSMELLPSLHPAGIAPKCEELFDKNGYAPLGSDPLPECIVSSYARWHLSSPVLRTLFWSLAR